MMDAALKEILVTLISLGINKGIEMMKSAGTEEPCPADVEAAAERIVAEKGEAIARLDPQLQQMLKETGAGENSEGRV